MDGTNIIPITIEDEMRGSYLDYAMSVIIGRALPDVRDGLKPVHRRILYAMLREGLTSGKKFSKCAGVVGEVLKKFHPHGDSAVYSSLVRMAQPWNLRYPLVEGQGNFGSIDGDAAAAYRYTECRLRALAEELLSDIDADTVDFIANFDDTTTEPLVLPSRIPNLLINGAEGIAVGMASSIPPHNLSEIIKAALLLIENPDATTEDLMKLVPGPDFPTGGIIYGASPIRQVYQTGRGLLKIRAKIHQETLKVEKRETQAIIIDEIPYQIQKAKLIEKIAELVNDKKIEGISRLRDESDRRGMRVVIELKRDAVSEVVINQLFKLTPMERTYGAIMLAIVEGRPQVLSLKDALLHFIEHRRTVIVRRTRFELEKAKARLHILDGLLTALENIDEVIKLIKASESTAEAREKLEKKFALSETQAQHILDMPLRRLTGLERKNIESEHKEISEYIKVLTKILSSDKEVDRVCTEELQEIGNKFGDERRTAIESEVQEIDLEDMIVEEDMVVSISHRGYAKRCSPSLYRAQRRGGKGVMGTKKTGEDEDFVSDLFVASTHAYLLVFTTRGKLHWIKVHQLPEAGRTARGRALVNILSLGDDEQVSAVLPVRDFVEGRYVVMATRRGYIKRVDLMEFSNIRRGGIRATTLDDDDTLIGVRLTDGKSECIVSTKDGMAIRFGEEDARVMGRTARGSRAVRLDKGDEAVNVVTVPAEAEGNKEELTLLTACQMGFGKRTSTEEYRAQARGGKGVIDIKTEGRNGPVIGTALVRPKDEVMLITTAGKVIRMPVNTISVIGRNTMGVRLVNLEEGETVAAMARLAEEDEDAEDTSSSPQADTQKGKGQVNGSGKTLPLKS